MRKAITSFIVALGFLVAMALPAQAVYFDEVVWFQMGVGGKTLYGKLYYYVDGDTNRRYVWNFGRYTDEPAGMATAIVGSGGYVPANAHYGTTYYYTDISPYLSTKNAFVEIQAANRENGVYRTAIVNLPCPSCTVGT